MRTDGMRGNVCLAPTQLKSPRTLGFAHPSSHPPGTRTLQFYIFRYTLIVRLAIQKDLRTLHPAQLLAA